MYQKAYLYRRIVQAKLFIDDHFNEKIDLSLSAGEAYFSKFHFIRLFKSAYGCTPHRYLTRKRIERATWLLTQGKEISEVCWEVGFESPGSFTALFKKQTGFTPSAFRTMALQKRHDIKEKPLTFIPNCFAEAKGWKKSNFEEAVWPG
jgi:AraC-like DNA-binding protein